MFRSRRSGFIIKNRSTVGFAFNDTKRFTRSESERFTLFQGDSGVVGTCKLDTHGFNTNDLQKINLYFENFIFPKIFRPKQKIFFRKISKFGKSRFK